jgi:signal transduction histidine kinase
MASDKFHKRIEALFADIDQHDARPDSGLAEMRCELESLRARVAELEARLIEEAQISSNGENPQTRPGTPILFEKEQVGYAFTGDRLESARVSALSEPDADHALLVPLTDRGKPIGAVVVEGTEQRPWLPEDAGLAEAVAQQMSLQIQNLRLLAAAERARSEAQAATRRHTHESWASFLDAIHKDERIAYAYDDGTVEPFVGPAPADADLAETVPVLEEQVGRLYLKSSPDRPVQDEDRSFVMAVARQIGQQVENLRLLADASRARSEAEEATRRLTRESWQTYMQGREDEGEVVFVYDQNQVAVSPHPPQDVSFSHPLSVRGEPIGQLAVAGGKTVSPEEADLMAAIATRASAHLEALRLTEELQKRAAQLQELDRLKSSFLANMSHELRTPLNSILGFSEVMLEGIDGPLTDYMENDLRLIQKNGQHLLHLINDVLDMAKIESGRMNLHPEKFKIQEVFEEVASITSTLASEKGLSLFIEPDSDKEVEIFADVTRLRQVMINLVNNSIKFTEKGKISMRADRVDEDKVMIKVKDTGIGIPKMHLETIFQEFAQVDTSTTRKVGGTGLGLPISRRLVEMHGGRMWAESTGVSGEGSVFYVELPLEARITETIEKMTR